MNRVDHHRGLQRYETWASGKTLAAMRTGAGEHIARARGIFAHIQMARHEWLARLGYHQRRTWIMFPDWDVDQCQADADRLDNLWTAYLDTLTDADLDAEVRYHSNECKPFTSLRRDILTHVYNHSTYHRGQIAILVKLAGGIPPDATDFIVLSRQAG